MLIDNESGHRKLYEWVAEKNRGGQLDIVTGYFTVGALSWLFQTTKGIIGDFRIVIGDIATTPDDEIKGLDLLNEALSIDGAFGLSQTARLAVTFLEQDIVKVKTLEPHFCHAKVYLYKDDLSSPTQGDSHDYYVTGSSNLTEAGLGLKRTSNVELNMVGQGTEANYSQLRDWFQALWTRPEAHTEKSYYDADGRLRKILFKSYLISQIQRIYQDYSPSDIYFKVLTELFGNALGLDGPDPDFEQRIGRLERTRIYNDLYEFQRKGALSLIRMIQKYNGAILADAVGLGKTWQALAVMKFFEMQGHDVILLCPKKLDHNWRKYLKKHNSRFEEDKLDFVIRYHSDLQDDRLQKHGDRLKIKEFFQNDRPKLIVIDESHNLRNSKSNRYKFLVDTLLKQNATVKVLMLSATPINNSMLDIRNQFSLIVRGENDGFSQSLDVRNLDYVFRKATGAFKEWKEDPDRSMGGFMSRLPSALFRLTDALTVARTRKMVTSPELGLDFPVKTPPQNVFVTPEYIGNFENFDELLDSFPKRLSAYMPSWYVDNGPVSSILEDEKSRDAFLVKMMYILMVKRLESSWYAFKITVGNILKRHQDALNSIQEYTKTKKEIDNREGIPLSLFEEEEQPDLSEYNIGTKRTVKVADIEAAGALEKYKRHLKSDVDSLVKLHNNLNLFEEKMKAANSKNNPADTKLGTLISKIKEKQTRGANHNNRKVLIFTVYKDTAKYLFDALRNQNLGTVGIVTADFFTASDLPEPATDMEVVLERFAPFTKLFNEIRWPDFERNTNLDSWTNFQNWRKWTELQKPDVHAKLQTPIDILIATDVLSEGQNLQDCDFVVNYDIHWNPVRVIQRMGRIDRLQSPNNEIFGLNFWPSENINRYLDLQARIEDRMAQMRIAGAEVDTRFTKGTASKAENDALDRQQNDRMVAQMAVSWDDIEVGEEVFGFDDLSLETYRQELSAAMQAQGRKWTEMPLGAYSGCLKRSDVCPKAGVIALLGFPSRPQRARHHVYKSYELIYVDLKGEPQLINQREVLNALALHKDHQRVVPADLDQGDPVAVNRLRDALLAWLKLQAGEIESLEIDSPTIPKVGIAQLDLIRQLQQGETKAVDQVHKGETPSVRYQSHKQDLLTWLYVQ